MSVHMSRSDYQNKPKLASRKKNHPTSIIRILAQYKAEHLSSLVTARNKSPPNPELSLKRMRELSDNKKIVVKNVLIILQENGKTRELLITDSTSEEVFEKFDFDQISSPIYKESNDPTDPFNNLFMFNVNADLEDENQQGQHEIHIFQCTDVPAHVIVDEINSSGNEYSIQHTNSLNAADKFHQKNPTPYKDKLNIVDHRASNKFEHQDTHINNAYSGNHSVTSTRNDMNGHDYAAYSIEEERFKMKLHAKKKMIDDEISLLNMCFDDIEHYVGSISKINRAKSNTSLARLSIDDNSSKPAKEVKKKKRFVFKKVSSSKPKELTIPRISSSASMVSIQEILISDEELKDLFEKIKFSIILLTRLQGSVTEPNPPLLTHRLFLLLREPIDFIRDPVTGKPEQARKIFSPVFSKASICLIQNSLSPPEIVLWHELGDAWCVPGEQMKEKYPIYVPIFKCGFNVDPACFDYSLFHDEEPEKDYMSESASIMSKSPYQHRHHFDEALNADFCNHMLASKSKIARAMRNFNAETDQELSLTKGEYVEVLDNSANWIGLRNRFGETGYAPYTFIEFDH